MIQARAQKCAFSFAYKKIAEKELLFHTFSYTIKIYLHQELTKGCDHVYQSKGMKHVSIQKVKDFLILNKIATKSEIVSATKLSAATITNILKELMNSRYIERVEDCESTGGRKAKRYRIRGCYMYFGLIHMQMFNHHTRIGFRIIDLDYKIVGNEERSFDSFVFSDMLDFIRDMQDCFPFEYVAVSVPGVVDHGQISECDIDSLNGMNIETAIQSVIPIHVTAENDMNTAVLGYAHFHTINEKNLAFIYMPDNHQTGCGLYLNGAIVYGSTHFAGELGFLPIGTAAQQEQLRDHDPMKLLVQQAVSIIAIVNPDCIVLYTPRLKEDGFQEAVEAYIPKQHLPEFIFVDNMDEFIFKGLITLSIESSRFKI